jgi:hypothetical protein
LANSIFHSQNSLADQKVTNEIDVQSQLTLPTTKYQRGETNFELTISDAHFERAQGSCAGQRWGGATAFKVVGASEEWEQSLASRNFQASPYGTILMQPSGGSYSSVFVNPNGSPIKIGAISTSVYANSYAKKSALRFKTNGWKAGEYTLIGFVSDGCRDFSMVTTKLVLPEIPKPELDCKAPESTFVGDKFEVTCSSTVELAANGAVIQFKSQDGWQESASMVATGSKFTFKDVQTENTGVLEMRVVLDGVMDVIQDSVSKSFFIQSNPQKLNASPTLVISKSNKESPTSISMNSGNNTLDATLQGSKSPNGPWTDISQIRSNATISKNLAFGSWVRVKYEGNTAVNAGVSDPYQILITPTFNCSFPSKIKTGQAFQVTCKANQSLQATPISLQYLNSANNWVTVDKGSASGSEPRFSFNLEGQGRQKLRIRSDGLRDYYTAFVSNTVSVDFSGAPAGSSNSSQSSSSSVPKGKVDKNSNAYKLMRTFGKNVASNSLASDTAKAQCLSAKNTGHVNVRGMRQYLGVQAKQIQSYLKTASGFQGCLDGFGK